MDDGTRLRPWRLARVPESRERGSIAAGDGKCCQTGSAFLRRSVAVASRGWVEFYPCSHSVANRASAVFRWSAIARTATVGKRSDDMMRDSRSWSK